MAVTIPDPESQQPPCEPRTAVEVVQELSRLLAQNRYEAIRSVYHPEARLITMAAGPEPLGPDEAYAALRVALRKASYRPPETVEAVAIDQFAAFGAANIRYPVEHGHAVARRVWLFTVKDGLLFRSVPTHSEAEACDRYQRDGRTLGF
jgi:hypothetical protein